MEIEAVLGNHFGFIRGKVLGMQLGCWNDIRLNFGHRRGIAYVLYRLAESI
jgi:hypothetical protein